MEDASQVGTDRSARSVDLVGLQPLMARARGTPEVAIGLVDGPVAKEHPGLSRARIRYLCRAAPRPGTKADDSARLHGTFVAGILVGERSSPAPAICPGCTLLVRPIFGEDPDEGSSLVCDPEQLADAIVECIEAGARIVHLGGAMARPSTRAERRLEDALAGAARHGVLVVAPAGNQGTLASSAITRHRWVLPVAGCDVRGRPMAMSNLGSSVARRGVCAPGEAIRSLGPERGFVTLSGTSFSAAFATGTAALLWSAFPDAGATELRAAMTQGLRRTAVVPPRLNASAAYDTLTRIARPEVAAR